MNRTMTHTETSLSILRKIVSVCLLVCAFPTWASDGKALFASCADCHGTRAEGNPKLGAPNIAGMPVWYLSRQLESFATGRRGGDKSDAYGNQMRAAVKVLSSENQRALVAQYIATLPPQLSSTGRQGGAADLAKLVNGRSQFNAICSSCHGGGGRGNQTLGAPSLIGLDAAYVERQMIAFRDGTRGSHPDDKWGAQMRIGAGMLSNATQVRDVSIYASTLK
jgi:cytochrome c553